MLRVGLVAEGKSEWLVIESIVQVLYADVEFVRIRPDLDMLSGDPFGWRGVKAWCRENGSSIETFMKGVQSKPLDLLVVHVDCSMAHNESAAKPCPPARDTANALRDVVVTQWLALPAPPPYVVLATPSKMIDAWVVATLKPPYRRIATIECEDEIDNEFVARGLLRKKDGQVKKPQLRYELLAKQVAASLGEVCAACTEADRFVSELQKAVTEVGAASPRPA